MSHLWGSIKSSVGTASQKTKLKAELLLIDRELKARQQAFGVQLYEYVSPLSKHADFFAADDRLTTTLRPPLLTAQREIAALEIRRGKLREQLNQASVQRQAAFATPAQDWQAKLKNAGKSTAMAGSEAKIKTEISMTDGKIKAHKQTFGTDLYPVLENLEDTQQWLPTDREIRSIYDACRKDMEKIKKRKASKEAELAKLGGPSLEEKQSLGDSFHEVDSQQQQQQPTAGYGSTSPYAASQQTAAASSSLPPSSSDPFAVPLSSTSSSPMKSQAASADPFAAAPQQQDQFHSGPPTPQPADPFATIPVSGQPSPPPPMPAQPPPPPPHQPPAGGQGGTDLLW